MSLQAFYRYAEQMELLGTESTETVTISLVLNIHEDGTIADPAWTILSSDPLPSSINGKAKKLRTGRPMIVPAFPGSNTGGMAKFLTGNVMKSLGVELIGEPVGNNSKPNALKSFLHYWRRVDDAHAATGNRGLASLRLCYDRYLATQEMRSLLPSLPFLSLGSGEKPILCAETSSGPIAFKEQIITFSVVGGGGPIFVPNGPLHDYWKEVFREEYKEKSPGRGICLITGAADKPIPAAHRMQIKGVPGTESWGGYLVSFDEPSTAYQSYGWRRASNAPVAESVAMLYAMGANHLLKDQKNCRKTSENSVIVSWVDYEPETVGKINQFLDAPSGNEPKAFFDALVKGERPSDAINPRHFHSMQLAGKKGRIAPMSYLDIPLRTVVGHVRQWFDDLEVQVARPLPNTVATPYPFGMEALARSTAYVPESGKEADIVFPANAKAGLYRAATEGINPRHLLNPLLCRLEIAATKKGGAVCVDTSRFALLKLILIRSQESPMTIEPTISESSTNPAYNCGRLLALLDDIQLIADPLVNKGIVQLFYAVASKRPSRIMPQLLERHVSHRAKATKISMPDAEAQRRDETFKQVDDVFNLFREENFPSVLSSLERGCFAMGFHQQKARSRR